jgi:ribosomal protein S27E
MKVYKKTYKQKGYNKVKKRPPFSKIDICGLKDKCPQCEEQAVSFYAMGYKYIKCDNCGLFRKKCDYTALL